MNDGLQQLSETVLRRHGWLSRQPDRFADDVLREGSSQRFGPGTEVFGPGDPAGGIYGVVDGVVALTIAPTGLQSTIVQHVGAGTWVGIMPFFGAPKRLGALRAIGDVVLFHLPLPAMEAMVARDPHRSRTFGEVATENVALFLQVIQDLLQPDTARRVAATLLRATRGGEVRVPLTQLDLATMANASRRQVNTILQTFASRGWIAQGYGAVTVLDPVGLQGSLEGAANGTTAPVGRVPAYSPPPSVFT